MKKGEKKKQERALKKRAERREAATQARGNLASGAMVYLRQALTYPLEHCWIQDGWREDALAMIVMARRQPNGRFIVGQYLVDLGCLGLKQTLVRPDVAEGELDPGLLAEIYHDAPPVPVEPDLAHEIIYGGIRYAGELGFRAHRDFRLSRLMLEPEADHPDSGRVTYGREGKPYYVAGPYDRPAAVLHKLERAVGVGNFGYLLALDEPEEGEAGAPDGDADSDETGITPEDEAEELDGDEDADGVGDSDDDGDDAGASG